MHYLANVPKEGSVRLGTSMSWLVFGSVRLSIWLMFGSVRVPFKLNYA
jgi:hypothetical protein